MSQQAVHAFLDRVAAEDEFREEVGRVVDAGKRETRVVVEFASELGFDFSEDEFTGVLEQRYGDRLELSDDELNGAAGGVLTFGSMGSIVARGGGGITVSFPDVCATPTGSDIDPIPYPNIATATDTGNKD